MAQTLFVVLIVVGFATWFVAVLPGAGPYWERIARGCFFVASLIWALGEWGGR